MSRQNLVLVDLIELNLTIGHIEDRAKSLINFSYLGKNYIFEILIKKVLEILALKLNSFLFYDFLSRMT